MEIFVVACFVVMLAAFTVATLVLVREIDRAEARRLQEAGDWREERRALLDAAGAPMPVPPPQEPELSLVPQDEYRDHEKERELLEQNGVYL